MGAVRGDKMIIFLSNNEQFLDGFLGGGVRRQSPPVPLAVGISDEHRHKLAARGAQAGQAHPVHRLQETWSGWKLSPRKVGETALFAELKARKLLGRVHHRYFAAGQAGAAGAPTIWAFIQFFFRASTSEPKGVMLTHGNFDRQHARLDRSRQVPRSGRGR